MIQEIEARTSEVTCDRVWNDAAQKIRLSYRNIDKFHFRVVPFNFEEFITSDRHSPVQLDNRELKAIFQRAPIKAWSVQLEPTTDYLLKSIDVDVPSGIPQGAYLLLGSYRGDFNIDDEDELIIREVWVSKLGILIRNDYTEDHNAGFVVDAQSGNAISRCNGDSVHAARQSIDR